MLTEFPTQPPNGNSVDDLGNKEVITFYGGCHAIRLHWRGSTDNHICLQVLTEDDQHWFASRNAGLGSSYWAEEMTDLMKAAVNWMKLNAEPDMHNGHQYGWKVRGKP